MSRFPGKSFIISFDVFTGVGGSKKPNTPFGIWYSIVGVVLGSTVGATSDSTFGPDWGSIVVATIDVPKVDSRACTSAGVPIGYCFFFSLVGGRLVGSGGTLDAGALFAIFGPSVVIEAGLVGIIGPLFATTGALGGGGGTLVAITGALFAIFGALVVIEAGLVGKRGILGGVDTSKRTTAVSFVVALPACVWVGSVFVAGVACVCLHALQTVFPSSA